MRLRVFAGFLAPLLALLVVLVGCAVSASAQADIIAVPPLSQRVTDLTQTLNSEQIGALTAQLASLEQAKGSQLAVLIVPSTGDESIEQFGIRVVDVWKLGRKGVDDGVLLLVAKNDRTVRIEVGRGLEGALPDVTAFRIIREFIVPAFSKGDFAGGIQVGVEKISSVIQGEALPAPKASANYGAEAGIEEFRILGFHPLTLGLMLLGGFILSQVAGNWVGRGGVTAAAAAAALATGTPIWLALAFGGGMAILLTIVSSRIFLEILSLLIQMRGGGGGGGGGFGGGGGGFGGGGASGKW
ncbi:TPM domain-containing protein [Undibacterium parvum]|uniref:YgcG family protein n=1 Tax=Undibacterium parvum TaxID=401471 RepID=A0A3S9HMG0_9BURK|nr:YgcG family protein [Undibacterium parvum]AZP13269.1 YgcG family protein [Undibacterium parvum]